jgi:hypothetical protein
VVAGAWQHWRQCRRAGYTQTKQKLRFSSAFTETDLAPKPTKSFAAAIKDDFDFEPYWATRCSSRAPSSSRFSATISISAISRRRTFQSRSLLGRCITSAYLFRDADHMKKTFKSDVGREFIKMAKGQLGIQIITPVYFGSRSLNLKPDKKVKTAEDSQGIKLRMPPGEFCSSSANRSVPTDAGRSMPSSTQRCKPVRRWAGQSGRREQADEVRRGDDTVYLTATSSATTSWRSARRIWDAMKPEQQAKFQRQPRRQWTKHARFQKQEVETSSTSRRKVRSLRARPECFPRLCSKTLRRKVGNDWPKGALRADQRHQVAARGTIQLAGSETRARLKLLHRSIALASDR